MIEIGTERAARVADLMQTVARLLVFVIIIPSAILLAVYFLLAGLIPEDFIRGMFSLTFGLGLAGMFVARMKRPLLGSFMTAMAALSGAASLAIFWNSLFSTVLLIHIYFIVLLGILNYLYRVHVIPPWRWSWIRAVSGFTIVLSAPLGLALLLDSGGFQLSFVIPTSLLLLWIYSAGAQYYIRDTRMGIPNTVIPALSIALIAIQYHLSSTPASDFSLTASVGLIGFGGGLFVISQILRFVQRSLSFRPVRKEEAKLRQAQLLREVGMDNYAKNIEESIEPDPEWIINTNTAQALTGISILSLATGFPFFFMWLSFLTSWGIDPAFNLLFFPIAALLTLLILVPSPMIFRMGGKMKKARETFIMKGISGLIVTDAVFISIIWTQHFVWTLPYTLLVALTLSVTGATGVFERVRHLWRWFGGFILHSLKRMHHWISLHTIHTVIVTDFVFTLLILYFVFPILNSMPNIALSFTSLAVFVFSIIALIGIAGLSGITRRMMFAAIGWSVLLVSSSMLTLWHLISNLTMDPILALAYSLTWFLGFAALQKADVVRRYVGIPFGLAVLGQLYIFIPFEVKLATGTFPFLSISFTLVLLGFMLHQEYLQFFNTATRLMVAAGMRVLAAASRAAQAIISSITRFLSAAKRILVRVGGFIYRGIVFLGVQLLRFVVVLYAAVIIMGISNLGYSMLNVTGVYDPIFVISVMFLSFFVLFSPSLLFRERHKSPLMQVCIVGLGVAMGVFVFSLDSALHLGIRIPLAMAASLLIFTVGRAWLPERMKLGLPIATWLSILSAGSFYTYVTFLGLSQVNAILISLLIFGIGLLPLRMAATLRHACGGAYLVLATPSGTLLVYMITLNLYFTLSIFALLPTVVLYRQYATGMRMIAVGFAKIGRLIVRELTMLGRLTAMYLAIYIVAASAILSVFLGILFVQFSMPFMQALLYSEILTILVFILVVMVLWLPFVGIRRIDYQSLLSMVLVIVVLVSGSITFLFTLPYGLFRAALFTISLTTLFGAMVIPGIHRVQSRLYPIVMSIAAFMVLCLDLLALDMVTNIGVASFCLALLAAPFISGVARVRLVYPITTTAFLGTLFYHMVLPVTDIWLSLSAFIAIEALLLMLPSETRSWQVWWAFSISIGYTTYALLAAFPTLRIISAIFLAIELVRLTPDIEYRFYEYYEVLSVSRAAILSIMAWLLFSPYLIFELAVEISIVLFFIVTTASMWSVSSPRVRTGLVDLLAISLTLLAITQFLFVLQLDFLFSVYMASVPLLGSFAYGSKTGVGRRAHWILLRGMVTVLIGFVWYGAYQSVESLILSFVTCLVAALAITLQAPWGIENKRSLTSALNGSIILLLQTLWIWHAILVFGLPANIILVGCSILLGSVILFPATGSINWFQFEGLWELVSFTVALTVGSALAGWDITQGTLPSNPILVAGWCLTCYSLVSVPMTLYGEKSQGMQKSEKVAQMAWVPAVLGLTILGYAFSFSAGYDIMYQLFTAGMAFSISFIVFAVLHPSPSSRLKVMVNMSFSLCMALLAFITFGWTNPVWSLGLPLMVWYLFSLPVLMHPTYLVLSRTYTIVLAALTRLYTTVVSGFTRIYSGIVAGLSRIYKTILANSDNIAFGFPVIIGVWFGASFFLNETCPAILGFDLRNCFQGVAVAAMAMGGLYFIEAWTLNGNVSKRVKGPSIALLGRGSFVLLLSIYLPEIAVDLNLLLYFVLGALSVSFFAVFTMNLVFGMGKAWRRSLLFAGITLLPALTLGLIIFQGQSLINALIIAGVASTLVEAPIIESQIRAFVAVLRTLGARIIKSLYNIGSAIKAFFARFGFINWVVFSVAFSTGLSWLSYPFFSELLGMTPGGILYFVPNVGIPILMLGILLLSVSIIRRTGNTSFVTACVIVSLVGAALTGSSWLFDHGLMIESVVIGVILSCLSGLALLRESQLHRRWVSALWIPIPLSLAVFVFGFLYPLGSAAQILPLAVSVAAMFGLLLLLLSAYSRLLPDSSKRSLWILSSITSAGATYTIAMTIGFQILASVYLSVFVMSWVMFPVTIKQHRHLFFAPLFFSLTGFAFTFVFGEYYQGLLLALSSFLLFIVLFVKERESKMPRLAYLRLGLLLLLLGSLTIFGLTMIKAFMVVG